MGGAAAERDGITEGLLSLFADAFAGHWCLLPALCSLHWWVEHLSQINRTDSFRNFLYILVAFAFVTSWDCSNTSSIFCRVQKLIKQFANFYVVVALPTKEQNDSFVQSYFRNGMEIGKPPFVPVQDVEMGFEKIVKIAHSRGACKQQDVMSKLRTERKRSVQVMDAFRRVMSSVPGLDDHDANSEEEKSLRDEKFKEGSDSSTMAKGSGAPNKLRKRPGRLVVPEYCPGLEFTKLRKKMENQEFQVQGRDYCLATKKGRRETLEDAYIVLLDVLGDFKQAFFAVVDGHGGRDAADYVVENLGKNIINALEKIAEDEENAIELAIRRGHGRTDEEFLSQGVGSGACAASVLVKDGELHVANVGDCRVVLSRNGVATALTKQHRVCREDERLRIEKSGGFVECKNGVWRVQGSLAVSRAIGDVHLKEWVISEPEIRRLPLTPDCEFLIMASDGLWDKVNDQEAVDEVTREMGRKDNDGMKACKRLMEMSFRRGNMDDVTVMVVHLQHFIISTI
ncbi:putative protein phosphatase 2C 2, partial [Cucurbita argyrosperma subsp. sororia]